MTPMKYSLAIILSRMTMAWRPFTYFYITVCVAPENIHIFPWNGFMKLLRPLPTLLGISKKFNNL